MQRVKLTVIMVCVVTIFGCKKDMIPLAGNLSPNTSIIDSLQTSSKDRELIVNLGKLTNVLKELYIDRNNLRIVNASIFSKAYTDESIMVKDLIFPTQSRLNSNLKFQEYMSKWNLRLSQFTENFWREVSKTNDEQFKRFLYGLVEPGSVAEEGGPLAKPTPAGRAHYELPEVTIYFPYTEERMPEPSEYYAPITTLVTATADADQGIGYQPYYVNGVFQEYRTVVVDDDYAEANPTQIVGLNGVEPYTAPIALNSAFPPGPAIDAPDFVREVKQVYIGDVRIYEKQYDKLISFTGNGGGSEIRFTRADGFMKVDEGQILVADMYHTQAKEVSRYNIRKSRWVDVSYEWDGDWELNNLQQNLGIYEEDNRNNATVTGSLTTTIAAVLTPITVTATRALGFTINYRSDDEFIKQINFNRDVFFVMNRTNLEGEMHNGWPVRDRYGPVSYTLNDRTFY